MNSKVAVIMSTYLKDNAVDLNDAIESIIGQPYQVDLYIFVDGSVSNESKKVLDFHKSSTVFVYDSPINVGLAAALNILIGEVIEKGYTYIARMDSDDISLPNRFSLQTEFLDSNLDVDVLGGACEEFGSSYAMNPKILPSTDSELKSFAIHRCPFIHPTVMFRSRIFKDGIRYPEDTMLSEDLALWHKLALENYTFHNLSNVILKYRISDFTLLRRNGVKKVISEFTLRFNYMKDTNSIRASNVLLLFFRAIIFMMPPVFLKFFYKYFR
ncbi:glycosyltransferase [Vibrio lentus]|uniref:glycosyltransferase n=1 Tax=Vibrio lentus TaxID=136468 RepID=UPI000C868419|nr:glycosyltransferase [Vibrio lentus]PMG99010.1 hypothetical protein BCU78_20680 [Vibrio lentus]